MKNYEKIYSIVKQIPKGKVLTYGKVAQMADIKSARVVGNIIHKNPDPQNIPCHRVVNRNGKLADKYAFGGSAEQARKLISEGIIVDDKNKINLETYLYKK